MEILTFPEPHLFFKIVVGIEIVVTLLIVLYASRWPREEQGS